MRLLGVEFANYACFDRQFVPIREGLNLLVGKNNSGKTALLKGLGAFPVVPIEGKPYSSKETKDSVNGLSGYLRQDLTAPINTIPSYDADVLFQVEPGDPLPIQGTEAQLANLISSQMLTVRYSFAFMPFSSDDQVVFKSGHLLGLGKEVEFLTNTQDGFQFRSFNLQLNEVQGHRVNTSGRVITGPERKNYWVPLPTLDYFKSFSSLLEARYVSAHRVAAPWIGIQTAEILPESAENLSVFLQTLRGNRPRDFQQIEEVMKEIFPSIAFVNPATQANRVQITLSHRNIERDIRLTHSGTGVEQVLAIATFATTAQLGAIMLLDEPHSFLHPTAERQLINFLKRDKKHQYVIATHSAIFINSVEADRITQVEPPGTPYQSNRAPAEIGQLLLDLGYKNSDILFYDFLIVVEGKSDRAILPILLPTSGASTESIERTGFPSLEGTPATTKDLQNAITRYEKLITAVSRKHLRRIYLLDGDRSPADKELLKKMRNAEGTESVPVRFLLKPEIENYLLVPDAIHTALKEEAKLVGAPLNEITVIEVKKRLDGILKHTEDKAVFPLGSAADAKGSAVLERLYASFENLRYDKIHSGPLIAKYVNQDNQPALSELRELTNDLFVETRAAAR